MLNFGTKPLKDKNMYRLLFKIITGVVIISIGVFAGSITNWLKLDSKDSVKTTDRNVYLKEVNKDFVSRYGITYEDNYTYFLRGDIETSLYRGEEFLTENTIIDTINVVLDKKIRKKVIQNIKPIKVEMTRGPKIDDK